MYVANKCLQKLYYGGHYHSGAASILGSLVGASSQYIAFCIQYCMLLIRINVYEFKSESDILNILH